MRTRRAFKRTIGILAVLLILSAALNIALIIMLRPSPRQRPR